MDPWTWTPCLLTVGPRKGNEMFMRRTSTQEFEFQAVLKVLNDARPNAQICREPRLGQTVVEEQANSSLTAPSVETIAMPVGRYVAWPTTSRIRGAFNPRWAISRPSRLRPNGGAVARPVSRSARLQTPNPCPVLGAQYSPPQLHSSGGRVLEALR